MIPARLYGSPQEFSEMMVRFANEGLGLKVMRKEEDPLLLDIFFDETNEEDHAMVSLHTCFQTYMRTGDLNGAIDFLNGVIRGSEDIRDRRDEMMKIDTTCVYPALREKEYVQAGHELVTEESLPGLCIVYLELKDGYSKLINRPMLDARPGLTEEKLKRFAFRNLRSEGWTRPGLHLQSPFRESCYVDTFIDPPFPVECQFLLPEMCGRRLKKPFLIAFPNRKVTLVMHSEERMDSLAEAQRLAELSRFPDVVKRSFRLMPQPVSKNIYWSCSGTFQRLEM